MKEEEFTVYKSLDDLPDNILEHILVRLPFKDTVKTSILSNSWQFKWVTVPDLVFDDNIIKPQPALANGTLANGFNHSKFVSIVDEVLLLHRGNIQKFDICSSYLESNCPSIDRWIRHLSYHHINQLLLDFRKVKEPYKVPNSLFSCKELGLLELSHCSFKFPQSFDGFPRLLNLILKKVTITENDFNCLISGCPLLEYFDVEDLNFPHVRLDCPKLKVLMIEGAFKKLSVTSTEFVQYMHISVTESPQSFIYLDEVFNMVKILGNLPVIKSILLDCYTLQLLSVGNIPKCLSTICTSLEYLYLSLNFKDVKEIIASFCLFRSAPNLQEFEIIVSTFIEKTNEPVGESWPLQDHFDCSFSKLRTVILNSISGAKLELQFIKYVLEKSPELKRMYIRPLKGADVTMMLTELVRFPRTSVEAEIVFENKEIKK